MKKILLILTLLLFPFITNAESDVINDFKMDIYIDSNGDAYVTETWNADANMGSEFYHTYNNYGNSTFSDYTVTMDEKEYTFIDNWNVDANIDDKAYKNGFNYTEDGIEICFGKSELGTHTYISKYKITNFILETKDSQIAYWTLLPHNNGGQFKNVHIKIYSDELYSNDLPVWGYGNYGGTAYVYDGYIEMNSEGTLDNDEYMTILVKYPLNTFKTTNIDSTNDFNYYAEMADKGSTHYEEKIDITAIITIIVNAFVWITVIGVIIKNASKAGKQSGSYIMEYGETGKKVLDAPMFREIPCKKNIHRAYWVANNYDLMKKQTDFLGAILLKWLKENKIEIKKEKTGIFKSKEENAITFITTSYDNELENELYKMMYEASKDGILESKEFEKWCGNNYSKILKWFNNVLDIVSDNLVTEGMLNKTTKTTLKIFKTDVYEVNPKMMEEATQMKGLKKFLEEFSQIDEKEAIEVKMWEEYLMYAQIFGIADKVAKQFKKLYPELLKDYRYDIDDIIFLNMISNRGMVSASTSKSRAESYNSGGGGFSSGGGGFGSFGGGGGGGAGGR